MTAFKDAVGNRHVGIYGPCGTGKTAALQHLVREALEAGRRVVVLETAHDGVQWRREQHLGAQIVTIHQDAVAALQSLDTPTLLVADDLHATLMPEDVPYSLDASHPYALEANARNAAKVAIESLLRKAAVRDDVRLAVAMQRPTSLEAAGRLAWDLAMKPVLMLAPGWVCAPEIVAMSFGPHDSAQALHAAEHVAVTGRGIALTDVDGDIRPVRVPKV